MLHSLFKEVISTALVGTNSLFREGVRGILHAPYQVETVSETIDALQQVGKLDLVILIADMDQSALPAQVRRAKEIAGARVVVVSDVDTSDVVWSLLAAGANGHLLRSISPEALRASLEAVMLGGTVVLPAPRKPFVIECADSAGLDKGVVEAELPKPDAEAEYKKLSDRETEILLRLTKGESNKQIARKFEITEATVKVHLKAILRKIRVSNRTQAAVWAHYNYVARSSHLTQAALADFRQDASRGPGVRKKFMTPHEDRVRQNIGVQEGALIVADSVN